jgi:hypothetical protein
MMFETPERFAKRLVAFLAALLAACGGSGSTGLIQPESGVLAEVRRNGTCVEAGSTLFCATDSTRADAPGNRQVETSGTVGVGPMPCPSPTEIPCEGPITPGGFFLVDGFGPGAACASASRSIGSTNGWVTGNLMPVGSDQTTILSPEPGPTSADALEVVLLCFDAAPPSLAPELAMLGDAGADVIFVPPLPAIVDGGNPGASPGR